MCFGLLDISRRLYVRRQPSVRNAVPGEPYQKTLVEHRNGIPTVCTLHIEPSTSACAGRGEAIRGHSHLSSCQPNTLLHESIALPGPEKRVYRNVGFRGRNSLSENPTSKDLAPNGIGPPDLFLCGDGRWKLRAAGVRNAFYLPPEAAGGAMTLPSQCSMTFPFLMR